MLAFYTWPGYFLEGISKHDEVKNLSYLAYRRLMLASVPTQVHGVGGDNGKGLGIPDTNSTSGSRRASQK